MSAVQAATAEQMHLAEVAIAGFAPIPLAQANLLLDRWAHYLGPCLRPFGAEAWALRVHGEPVAVALGASSISSTAAGRDRHEVVELARLCTKPGESWATRVALRLWREVAAPAWPHWQVTAAIAYSQNANHDGRIYRFDGWKLVTDKAGSNGGGAWSRPRYAGDAAHGRKSLWLWSFGGDT
jgi:hypothetical protein